MVVILIMRTATHNKVVIMVAVFFMRTDTIVTISSLTVLLPSKTLAPSKLKLGHDSLSLSCIPHIKGFLMFHHHHHPTESKSKTQGHNPLYEDFVRTSTAAVMINIQSRSKYHINHKYKQIIASTKKRDLQKVEPKKMGLETPTRAPERRAPCPSSNPHADLTAQVDPRITLRQGEGWGENNFRSNGEG